MVATREQVDIYAMGLALRAERDPADRASAADARDDLIAFTRATFPRYQPAPHHRAIAERLEAVERGDIDRLIITVPPRHGKSELASVRFPAWYLGRNPDRRIIAASYAASLAYRMSRQARNIIGGPGWPFPALTLAGDSAQVQQWDIAGHRGGYFAAGVGGGATGQGAHLFLIDDPVKNLEEADSPLRRDTVWDWYQSVAYTRLEERAAICLIMTRWHHDDLAGRILAAQEAGGDQWEVLHLPAVADVSDPLEREPGAALWPEKYDLASLERTKVAVGARVWSALYQGTPSNDESALLKREWWRFYGGPTGIALPPFWDQALQSWDMTFKGGTQNDYVAGQVWARRGADCYLLARDKRRLDFPATLAAIRAMSAQYPDVHTKLVEDTANGPAVIATLEREIGGLVAVRPEGGKVARVNAVAGLVEAGNVWLPHPTIAPWVGDFIEECAAFPTGAHDDDVDAMSQALVRLGASNVIQIGTYLGAARR
jgi:predicted phage terminase large subunit-like protein